jgi:hypothetical protein
VAGKEWKAIELVFELLLKHDGAPEPYLFTEQAYEGLAKVVDLIFSNASDPRQEVSELFDLARLLATELQSPTAAAVLRDVLEADPRVTALLGDEDSARCQTARWCGASELPVQAPRLGAAAPHDSLKLSSMFIALDLSAERARASARRSAKEEGLRAGVSGPKTSRIRSSRIREEDSP